MAEADDVATSSKPEAALKQVFALLKARDDTSRFVGLSLLRTLLDSNEDLRENASIIDQCWDAVPNKFLTRLMKAAGDNDEAKNMNNLAVAVVHSFANLLPPEKVAEKKMLEMCEPLVQVTSKLEPAPQTLAFQALQCMVDSTAGAHTFSLAVDGVEDLSTAAMKDERLLREYLMLYCITLSRATEQEDRPRLERYVWKVLARAEKADPGSLLVALESMGLSIGALNERKLHDFIPKLIQKTVSTRPTAKVREASIKLASQLLQQSSTGDSLAIDLFLERRSAKNEYDEKPFAYIFMQYVLIDLRSTIPTLMTNLASPRYQTDSLRLAACYDVVAAFIMYLIQTLDDDEDLGANSAVSSMSPDLLLKLRRDLSETFSLTLEFLRDRWDAVIAGAGGLDPSARTDPKAPAMLTWDNPHIAPENDPIILSALRALSLWLKEDENSQLMGETMAVADMIAALYGMSMKDDAKTDFRHPILVLLEGLLQNSDEAVQLLLDHGGWSILAADLDRCSQPLRRPQAQMSIPALTRDLLRVMLAIVVSDAVPQSREAWMDVVKWSAEVNGSDMNVHAPGNLEAVETIAELYQLSDTVASKAPRRLQQKYGDELQGIARNASLLASRLEGIGTDVGLVDSFKEVAASLEG